MVVSTVTVGHHAGTVENDILTSIAQPGTGQIHTYAKAGDDMLILDFAENISGFSHGHHARGDGSGGIDDTSWARGHDTFSFTNTQNVGEGAVVVGRLEDFDSRDRILIDGVELDLHNLPPNVRIVEFNGEHDRDAEFPQQWLLISTETGGIIFYSLEGARVDMEGDGGSNANTMEKHFISESALPDFALLRDVIYRDPQNYVPEGYTADGGDVINDDDENFQDVLLKIRGSDEGDLIAAGLNDDSVFSYAGNDQVWGGTGHDHLNGGGGNDTTWGGDGNDFITSGKGDDVGYGETGNDDLRGWAGHDLLFGGVGDDLVHGGSGNDTLYGDEGNDRVIGGRGADLIYGGSGDDELFGWANDDILGGGVGDDKLVGGGGNDLIIGGAGRDVVSGGQGSDMFAFQEGDLVDWDDLDGSLETKNQMLDVIEDFELGTDLISLDTRIGAADASDLKIWETEIEGDKHFTIAISGTNQRFLVNVDEDTEWEDMADAENFDFF